MVDTITHDPKGNPLKNSIPLNKLNVMIMIALNCHTYNIYTNKRQIMTQPAIEPYIGTSTIITISNNTFKQL